MRQRLTETGRVRRGNRRPCRQSACVRATFAARRRPPPGLARAIPARTSPRRAGLRMKVTVERAQLLKSLGHVHRVVERRNTIPILANVLMRGERAKLSLKATDLDLEVIETIAAEVAPGGATTVPAHMFYEIVRKLPEGSQIVLEASGDRAMLAIRAGRSRFTLQTLPESDFPDLAAGDMTHTFTLPAADLKRLIDKTQFAISTEETRYYLNGIYLHTAGTGKAPTLARGRDRRPSAGPVRIRRCRPAPPACRASSCRARRWARCSA